MSFLIRALRIFKDAVFTPSLPLRTRALLLILQPITLLTYTIEWAISRKFPHSSEIRIPIKGNRKSEHALRAVVYTPKPKPPTSQVPVSASPQPQKVPLHLNIHGGAFLGGLPEGNARFCHRLAEKSGAVVVSTSYRYAPAHTFPASHEDVRDVAEYLLQNAERLWGADPAVFTVSGFSVGGNLAFSVAQELSGSGAVKGLVSFEGVVDFRLPPWDKPKPPDFPAVDPLAILQPLFDAYAGPNRARDMGNPLLHPTLADLSVLPQNVLFVVGGADILRDETVKMAERLEQEAEGSNRERKIDTPDEADGMATVVRMNVAEGQIHGWTELPSFAIDEALRTKAFDDAISFLRAVHRSYGFVA